MPSRYDGDPRTERDLETGFAPPRGQRTMLLTTTEIGWAAGYWHLLDIHGNPYCDEPGQISTRDWLADKQRSRLLRLCAACRLGEPTWPEARRKDFFRA